VTKLFSSELLVGCFFSCNYVVVWLCQLSPVQHSLKLQDHTVS
jgi:hypothetical protein